MEARAYAEKDGNHFMIGTVMKKHSTRKGEIL